MVDRAADDVAGEIDHPDVLRILIVHPAVVRVTAAGDGETHPEVPLAEAAGGIALLL